METWDEIRDEIAGMLADGQPLEDVITKLEKRKNEMAKANLLKAMDEMKNPKPMTNEEWFCGLSTEEKARFFDKICYSAWGDINSRFRDMADYTDWIEWLKEKHE